MTKSKSGVFTSEPGIENSLTIKRTGLSGGKIGFVSQDGEFFIETDNDQFLIHPEHLIELSNFIQLLTSHPVS